MFVTSSIESRNFGLDVLRTSKQISKQFYGVTVDALIVDQLTCFM